MNTLPWELHAHICGYLDPLDRAFARCAWAGFARVMPLSRASTGVSLCRDKSGKLRPTRRQRALGYYIARLGRVDVADRAISAEIVRPKKLFKRAAETGQIEILKWLHNRLDFVGTNSPAAEYAAAAGQIDALKFLTDAEYDIGYLRGAFSSGHIECIEHILAAGEYLLDDVAVWAAESGSMRMIEYARGLGCSFGEDAFRYALHSGNIECIAHLYSEEYLRYSNGWDLTVSRRPEVLDWLAANGREFTTDDFDIAAAHGALKCMKWLYARGIRGTDSAASLAMMCRTDKCIKWMYSTGHKMSTVMYCHAAKTRDITRFDWLFSIGVRPNDEAMESAVIHGFIDGVKWLMAYGIKLKTRLTASAARWGRPQMMRWLHKHGCKLNPDIVIENIHNIAICGDRESPTVCIEYAHKHGVPIDFPQCAAYLVTVYESRWIQTANGIPVDKNKAEPYHEFMRWLKENSPVPIDAHLPPPASGP